MNTKFGNGRNHNEVDMQNENPIKRLSQTAFLRLPEVLKIIPVSKSTWWAGVKTGKYPRPVKLSERCTAWRSADILRLIEEINANDEIESEGFGNA